MTIKCAMCKKKLNSSDRENVIFGSQTNQNIIDALSIYSKLSFLHASDVLLAQNSLLPVL